MFGTTQKTPQSWDVSISTMASDPAAHSNNSYSKGDQSEGSLGESLISASAPLRWSIHWSMFEDAEWKKSGWWGFRSYVSIAINTTLRLPETSNVIQPPVRKTCGQLGCYVQMTGICAFVCHSKEKNRPTPHLRLSIYLTCQLKAQCGREAWEKHSCLSNFQYSGWFVENPKVHNFNAVSWYFMVDDYPSPNSWAKRLQAALLYDHFTVRWLGHCVPFVPYIRVTGDKMWWWLNVMHGK
jgi:hypothetical protein